MKLKVILSMFLLICRNAYADYQNKAMQRLSVVWVICMKEERTYLEIISKLLPGTKKQRDKAIRRLSLI